VSKKVGNLSEQERRMIIDHHKKMSIEELAEMLNRTPELIKRHLMQKGLYVEKTTAEIEEDNRLKMTLYNLAYWPTVLAAYDDDEIKLFEENWLSIVKQLQEDVTYTEQLYIQSWIILLIERHRILSQKKEQMKTINELKAKVAELEITGDPTDFTMAQGIRGNLALMEGAKDQHVASLQKLEQEIKHISAKVKADRDNRRKVETSADTYWGYVELLNDEKYKADESYKAELGRIAQEKSRDDLMSLTTFDDGTVDYPLLNEETMRRVEENK
jgi:hypothetical protein